MIGVSPPTEGEAGQTGTWRSKRPVIDRNRCLTCREKPRRCNLCWLYCPEAAITQAKPPVIDYRYCKGCGICASECPAKAIDMEPEEP
jgi:pyruvate ferredoxin oxidoreductase delta subunit